MITCPCGHTLEVHESTTGCGRCDCRRDRTDCLDAAIELARAERVFYSSNAIRSGAETGAAQLPD